MTRPRPSPETAAPAAATAAAVHEAPIELRIKKLPKELRRRPYRPDASLPWHRRTAARLRHDPQFLRHAVQLGFAALCVWIGVEFYLFVQWGQADPLAAPPVRPPGSEAFLPISGLMGLVLWLRTGVLNDIHPAATIVLLAVVATAVLVKKSFCSWICPAGTLGEWLGRAGKRLFGRTFLPPKWVDWPLRSLKYLLLVFFVGTIVTMGHMLPIFVDATYNRVADIKMYLFFAHLTPVAAGVFGVLVAASMLIDRFWCRYLCPYGALLGVAGLAAPLQVTRVKASCIDCELCTRACPSKIAVHRIGNGSPAAPVGRVLSDECSSCLQCVDACPVKETLVVQARPGRRAVPGWVVGALVVATFAAVTGAAMLAGRWQNAIGEGEYREHFRQLMEPRR